MAAPPNPTILGLIQEGMRKALGRIPSSGEQARALDEWAEEIKNEVWLSSNTHELLEAISLKLVTEGTQRYAVPTDSETIHSFIVLDGDERSTAQAGANTTITLVSSDSTESAGRIAKEILLISGTGSGQKRTITGYNSTTKVATVDTAWATNPDSTTKYIIISDYISLKTDSLRSFNLYKDRTVRGRPERAIVYQGEIYVWPVPDKTYGLISNYWVNIQQLDRTADAYTTMLRKWRSLFTEGFYIKTLQDEDDARYASELPVYVSMISRITDKTGEIGHVEGQSY